jgi:two-component system, NarL family, response regulator NreC
MGIRILHVGPESVSFRRLYECLSEMGSIDSVLSVRDIRSARERIEKKRVDVIILDIDDDFDTSLSALSKCLRECPHLRILAYASREDGESVLKTLCSGASGYLLKERSESEIGAALAHVMAGLPYISRYITRRYFPDSLGETVEDEAKECTPRERIVFDYIVKGMTCKEIADIMHIDYETVRTHKKHIMDKLGVRTTVDLVRSFYEMNERG